MLPIELSNYNKSDKSHGSTFFWTWILLIWCMGSNWMYPHLYMYLNCVKIFVGSEEEYLSLQQSTVWKYYYRTTSNHKISLTNLISKTDIITLTICLSLWKINYVIGTYLHCHHSETWSLSKLKLLTL